MKNNNYLVVSVNNGLFTTGGHLIAIVGIDGDMLKIYDPYLYAGKFETSTRRGKVMVEGNTVWCSVENFRNYANYNGFYAYKNNGNTQENNSKPVTTEPYTRYVKANDGLNVRNAPNGTIVGALANGSQVTVYEHSGSWSRIGTNKWVSSNYLVSYVPVTQTQNTVGITKKFSRASILYSNSNLTGYRYNYKANTTITILQNISSTVDKVRVNQTGRIAYINTNNYSNTVQSYSSRSTVGQYKRFKTATTLYSNSNLTGIRYTYLPLTQIKIIRNVSSNIDYVYVVKTGRYAYVNINNYK